MRFNEGKTMHYWLAGAATLLLASAQPALAACEADNWNLTKKMKIDYSDYEPEHVAKKSEFLLEPISATCGLKLLPRSAWNAQFADLPFNCKWEGRYATDSDVGPYPRRFKPMVKTVTTPPWWENYYHCVSTRVLSLHTNDAGVVKEHEIVLIPYYTQAGGRRQRAAIIYLVDTGGPRHGGVAHGTGDE